MIILTQKLLARVYPKGIYTKDTVLAESSEIGANGTFELDQDAWCLCTLIGSGGANEWAFGWSAFGASGGSGAFIRGVFCLSAGTHTYHVGEPKGVYNSKMNSDPSYIDDVLYLCANGGQEAYSRQGAMAEDCPNEAGLGGTAVINATVSQTHIPLYTDTKNGNLFLNNDTTYFMRGSGYPGGDLNTPKLGNSIDVKINDLTDFNNKVFLGNGGYVKVVFLGYNEPDATNSNNG